MLRVRVSYADPASLADDCDRQFRKGGLLLRVEPPPEIRLFDPVELELVTHTAAFVLSAQVVQHVPGVGLAVSFDANDPRLAVALEQARDAAAKSGGPTIHQIVETGGIEEGGIETGEASAASGPAAKIHAAKYGNKEDRMRIMREGDRSLHRYVLRNPGLRLDEVTFIAKLTSVSVDLLLAIAERRDWVQRPEIALALVRNPKTPVPLAIQLLQHVAPAEVRRLAKGSSVRMPILQAARKRVVG